MSQIITQAQITYLTYMIQAKPESGPDDPHPDPDSNSRTDL